MLNDRIILVRSADEQTHFLTLSDSKAPTIQLDDAELFQLINHLQIYQREKLRNCITEVTKKPDTQRS